MWAQTATPPVCAVPPPSAAMPAAEAPAPFASAKLRYTVSSNAAGGSPNPIATLAGTLRREEALAAVTSSAAWAAFADGRIGRIAIGQRADFVLVDRDPLMAPASEVKAIRVLQTWIGGKPVYQAKDTAVR